VRFIRQLALEAALPLEGWFSAYVCWQASSFWRLTFGLLTWPQQATVPSRINVWESWRD